MKNKEIDKLSVDEETARIALYKASTKLPIKTKFIKRFQNMKNKEIKNATTYKNKVQKSA